MTADQFALLAQGLGPNVSTKSIFDSVQFRVGGKAFATVGWPGEDGAVVKVDPRRQAWALSLGAGLTTEPGRRRKAGIVLIRLGVVDEGVAAELLGAAWRHARPASGAPRATATPMSRDSAAAV